MITVAAWVACVVLALLAVFQLALIAGAPLGRFAWGGAHDVLPTKLRVGSVVSIVLYAMFAAIILEAAGVTDLIDNEEISRIGIWVLVVYFGLGVVMNAMSRSKPERLVMTPVALVLALACAYVALG